MRVMFDSRAPLRVAANRREDSAFRFSGWLRREEERCLSSKRADERPLLLPFSLLQGIVLDISNRSFDIILVQVNFPLSAYPAFGYPIAIDLVSRKWMNPFPLELLRGVPLQLNHQLLDFHRRSARDEMHVIRQDCTR